MKLSKIFLLCAFVLVCGGFVSCSDDDDNVQSAPLTNNTWMSYVDDTEVNVEVSDPAIKESVEEFVNSYRAGFRLKLSILAPDYEYVFGEDGQYTFTEKRFNIEEDKKTNGTYTYSEKTNTISFGDPTISGLKDNHILYITTDLRSRAADSLEIEIDKITKAEVKEKYTSMAYYYGEYPGTY